MLAEMLNVVRHQLPHAPAIQCTSVQITLNSFPDYVGLLEEGALTDQQPCILLAYTTRQSYTTVAGTEYLAILDQLCWPSLLVIVVS